MDARVELETAVDVARTALANFNADPTPAKFRIYRDASEIAIKWHRAVRLGGEETSDSDADELEKILG